MRLGLVLPFSGDAPGAVRTAQRAQELGFDGIFATDHLFVPGRPDAPTLDPFTLLSAIAVACPGLHVGTLVARVTVRPAVLLAKMAANLDDLSGGRALIGLGSGDRLDQPENRAFGIAGPDDARGRLEALAETAGAVRALFRGQPWPGGNRVPAISGRLAPPPSREGGPPLWIGGSSEAVVRVAAEQADAWNGWGFDLEGFEARTRVLAGSGVEATWAGIVTLGDDPGDARRRVADRLSRGLPEVWSGDLEAMRGFLRGLAEAGATWAICRLPLDRAEVLATLLPEVHAWT